MAESTGLTKAAVSSLVDTLVQAGLVAEAGPQRGQVGRPGNPLALNASGPAGLGVEVAVDYFAVCVVDFTSSVRFLRVVPGDNRKRSADAVLHRASLAAQEAITAVGSEGLSIAGLSVAAPGLVDREGRLRRSPHLPGWEDIAVARHLRALLDLPLGSVACDNEVNLAALAELWSSPSAELHDFVFVGGEVGIGAGIVIDGRLRRGARGFGGELGHISIDRHGAVCTCGARGCLEMTAGQEAILRAIGSNENPATSLGSPQGHVNELAGRAWAGDRRTLRALSAAGEALGVALSALLNIIDVPTIVLGGLYADLASWLERPLVAELQQRVLSYQWAPTRVVIASRGPTGAVWGAANAIVRAIIDDPESVLLEGARA